MRLTVLLRVGTATRAHKDVGCSRSINIHQRSAKATMFRLCDFTLDQTKMSLCCLSCDPNSDGDGKPEQVMIRKQQSHWQSKIQFDVTEQCWIPSSAFRLHAMCS